MGFFQNSVIQKHLKTLDKEVVNIAYAKFKEYFHNPEIQQNIRDAKEEQFQEGFLRELFVNVLGYTLNPKPNYNLTTEYKNEKGAKKTDGAILLDGKALAVIELKGTDTKDLDKINAQAFSYKNNQTGCIYVITSNFEKLRFFIHNSVDHIEFNLFTLTRTEFELLWLCLNADSLLGGVPLKAKEESLLAEENITKQLYKNYSDFRTDLWQNMVKNTPEADHLLLFKKTQKLLDRFLFIFFAEDSGLLPPNSILRMVKRWQLLKEEDAYKPLYVIFKQYFGYINTGRQGKIPQDDIFAYNGGLFFPDDVLDSIVIDDEVLKLHVMKLTNYDFQSEVDVNILGHIFENSLNEIENVTAQLEGQEIDKSKTKRKKDGVYYTPKYITKYIVENTVGKLCEKKKAEFGVIDEEYAKGRSNRKKETIRKLDKSLQAYRNWLLNISICDPACGSGAFLNQSLDFLIGEHSYIDELQAQLLGQSIVFQDVSIHILEKNIYGVDINEESVDIAKLSLWLRTAQRGRKLTFLNNNIKCGNSLVDDPEVAGEKAFNWQKEFPTVFKKGGFDVVIGNPPYVRQELLGEIKPYLEKIYHVFEGTSDLFAYFYEKAFQILKHNGIFGFISNTFDKTKAAVKLRDYLTREIEFIYYVDFTEVQIFEGATTYPIILIASNSQVDNNFFTYLKIPKNIKLGIIEIGLEQSIQVDQNSLRADSWSFNSTQASGIINKIRKFKSIRDYQIKSFRGIVTGFNEAFIIDRKTKEELEKAHHSSKELIKSLYEGKDLSKWHSKEIDKFIIFTRRGTDIDKYPAIKEYLEKYRERLTPINSPEIKTGRKPGPYKWFEIQDSVDYFELFEKPKITWPNLQSSNKFCFDHRGYYINAPSVIFPSENKALLCILNSKVVWEFLKSICVVRSGGYIEVKPQYFEQIPIPEFKNEEAFNEKANEIINHTSKLQTTQSNFINLLQSKIDLDKLSKKLQNWNKLELKEFLKELKKNKRQLSLSEEADWMQYFNEQKQKAVELETKIDRIDKEIDKMVYDLYGLTEEEVIIIEQG